VPFLFPLFLKSDIISQIISKRLENGMGVEWNFNLIGFVWYCVTSWQISC